MTWRLVAPHFARRIQLAAFIIAMGFGLDYLFTPPGSSTALTFVERGFLPLWVWGATIIGAGLAGFLVEWLILGDEHPLLATSKRWKWGWVSNTAHTVIFAAFVVLASSSLFDIIGRGLEGGGWYGWRTALMWGGFAYANFQFIRRIGQPI